MGCIETLIIEDIITFFVCHPNHQICIKKHRCEETAQQIRGQEMAEIHQSVTKSQSGLGSTKMNVSAKFETNQLSSLPRNVQKPQKCERRMDEQTSLFL